MCMEKDILVKKMFTDGLNCLKKDEIDEDEPGRLTIVSLLKQI